MSKLIAALVLCDIVSHGLKAGQIVEATSATLKQLDDTGSIDTHKDAVAAGRSRGCVVVRSTIELQAEQRAAAASALRVEIAQLEDLKAKASDEATAAALAADIARKQADLVALG